MLDIAVVEARRLRARGDRPPPLKVRPGSLKAYLARSQTLKQEKNASRARKHKAKAGEDEGEKELYLEP